MECRKTKTKVITPANHNKHIYPMNQSELEANTCNWRQARENACEQVVIGLSFTSDWSREWCEIFSPITKRRKETQRKARITFYIQLKTDLIVTWPLLSG